MYFMLYWENFIMDKKYFEPVFSIYIDKKTLKAQQVEYYGQCMRRLAAQNVTAEPLVVDIDSKETFRVVEKTIKVLEPVEK